MSQLNFAKVVPGQTLNFAKDLGETVSGILTFNLNWGKIGGNSVDLDAILVTKSKGQPYPAREAVAPTTSVVKKASTLGKLFGGKDTVVTTPGTPYVPAGVSTPGLKETLYFGTRKDSVRLFGTSKPLPAIPGALHHGDDLTGSSAKGEYIEVHLDKLPADVDELVFSVISFSGDNFADLPFASIEIFTGAPSNPGKGLVSMELTQFNNGTKAVVLAKVSKNVSGEWEITGLKLEGSSGSVYEAERLSKEA